MPGAFTTATLSWTPDTMGLMSLTAKVVLANDPDSLNDVTYPFLVSAIPFVGNEDEVSPHPALTLHASPNPFRSTVSLQYRLDKAGPAKLEIYNLKGQKVWTVSDEKKPAGLFSVTWNGLDKSGNQVPNGIYFCRLTTLEGTANQKLVMLR